MRATSTGKQITSHIKPERPCLPIRAAWPLFLLERAGVEGSLPVMQPWTPWMILQNRLYYAAYYAVSALLIAYKIPAHSHDGNIQQFGLHFVKSGKVSRENGKLLRQLFTMRQTGDYSDRFDLVDDDVIPMIQPTEDFIESITTLAKEKLGIT
ncbi:MAG: HEPN domain-containing protein [Prevotella sp.]|nr:HEPN domain-containing protein [Prevotella sp.]